jgi:hypothetical protein
MRHLNYFVTGILALLAWSGVQAANLTTQDLVEIQQLYAKYNHAIDSGNAEVWADTFTDDGVFNTRFKGRDQLMGFIKTWRERMNGANRRHWNSNLLLAGTNEGADGSVYLMLWDIGAKPQAVVSTGMYEDKLVKTKSGWRFKSRVVKGDAPPAAATPTPATP